MKSQLKRFIASLLFKMLFLLIPKHRLKKQVLTRREKLLVKLQNQSYLDETGWLNSAEKDSIVDKQGNPLPWLTYPVIYFLAPRLKQTFNIFEYGSGNSTFYFAKRVNHVISLEHDEDWYHQLKPHMPHNAHLSHKNLEYGGEYCKSVLTFNQKFDIIVIDGRDRVNCCYHCLDALSEEGVIIFDNTNRAKYEPGVNFFLAKGFKKLDFTGIAPRSPQLSCTSIFYRSENCLNI